MEPNKGIPIGNLTSQYFANYYLAFLDHLVKEQESIKGYVRYMDDFVLWHNDKAVLKKLKIKIEEYCLNILGLKLKPCCLNQSINGVSMLGHRVFGDKLLLTKKKSQ